MTNTTDMWRLADCEMNWERGFSLTKEQEEARFKIHIDDILFVKTRLDKKALTRIKVAKEAIRAAKAEEAQAAKLLAEASGNADEEHEAKVDEEEDEEDEEEEEEDGVEVEEVDDENELKEDIEQFLAIADRRAKQEAGFAGKAIGIMHDKQTAQTGEVKVEEEARQVLKDTSDEPNLLVVRARSAWPRGQEKSTTLRRVVIAS
eukprot:CAMPEP_0115387738 /NCGR_PEP_ID=MMETSP0271-20121206/8815_1 /TAXON_ID=71861 /ORGANISM="Scrippsiella trochoidea, Strain CCMP3099" /LENGTH=203 /DNA_ID=CAMNT_0002811207 /DNA_START=315 /DNA_END=924 /DNA_ORIENTATION=+